MEKVNNLSGRSEKLKARWECTNFSFERDRSFGYSWPQRNYNCNFCKKEFKSAQALGGHMNVHRRDRAKQLTQQYSPSSSSSDHINYAPLPSNPNPNSNPKLLSPPPPAAATRFFPYITYAAASSAQEDGVAVSPQIREIRKKLAMEANFRHEFKGLNKKQEMSNNEVRVWKKKNDHDQFLGLDLNMTSTHEITDGKEDLDLELRLGRF